MMNFFCFVPFLSLHLTFENELRPLLGGLACVLWILLKSYANLCKSHSLVYKLGRAGDEKDCGM
jgi:hypothetical protein